MEKLPATHQQDAKVVEAEVVGREPPSSFWQRVVSRLAFSLVLGGVGLCAIVLGAILTVTIVGAVVGIPMILVGLILILVAGIVGVGGGQFKVIRGFER